MHLVTSAASPVVKGSLMRLRKPTGSQTPCGQALVEKGKGRTHLGSLESLVDAGP